MATKTRTRQRQRVQPDVEASWFAPAGRAVVIAATVLVLLVIWTSTTDVYVLPKAAVLALAGLGAVGLWVWQVGTTGVVRIPRSPAVVLAGAVAGLMALATIVGQSRASSFYGEYGRSAGLLTYAAAVILFVLAVQTLDQRGAATLARWLAAAGALVVIYGFVQALGGEPLGAPSGAGVIGTLGQVNFLGGFVGMLLPFLLWVAAERSHADWVRLGAVGLAVMTVFDGIKTDSFQTYLSIGAGVGVFVAVWCLDRWGRRRLAIIALVVVVVGLLGGLVLHNRIESQVRSGLDERVLMWQAAGHMIEHHPILGDGPSTYGRDFGRYRPLAHARFGVFAVVDTPHDVPLSMFVAGGVLLGLAYLGFVGVIGWQLVRGLRRTIGGPRLLLAAFGAAWLAYQAQSLVSIDVPPLILWHFICAAAIVALAGGGRERVVVLRGLTQRDRRGGVTAGSAGRVLQGGAAVVLLVLAWFVAIRPMAADIGDARALDARAAGDFETAIPRFRDVTGTAPWIGRYWADRAGALAASGDQDQALLAGIQSAEKAPSIPSYALSTAQLAARMGRHDIAEKYFRFAEQHNPTVAVTFGAHADYMLSLHRNPAAITLLRHALRLQPNQPQSHLALAQIYELQGQPSKAKAEYEQVLRLEPNNGIARDALAALA